MSFKAFDLSIKLTQEVLQSQVTHHRLPTTSPGPELDVVTGKQGQDLTCLSFQLFYGLTWYIK